MELTAAPQVDSVREIIGTIENRPLLSPPQIALAHWLADYYICPLFDAVALMLPPGFERRTLTFLSIPKDTDLDAASLKPELQQAAVFIRKKGRVSLRQLQQRLGHKKAEQLISQLARRGLVLRQYEPEPVKIKPKHEDYLSLAVRPTDAFKEAARLQKRAPRQAALLSFLAQQDKIVSLKEARDKSDTSKVTANALIKAGLVSLERVEVKRHPFSHESIRPSPPLKLTTAQDEAVKAISAALKEAKPYSAPPVFLLHGVTGSGKTEVYLQALAETMKLGKRGIALVPEIALTPQTIERFAARFPRRVAVIHSQLSLGEQFDEWRQIREECFDIVTGPRGALFAPQSNLGLIIIDEEHEWSYKQQDKAPRYHSRNVAIKLAELSGAVVVLGSATPDVESYYHAMQGDYKLIRLPQRLTPHEGTPLPRAEVVDLKEELKVGNKSIFSRCLKEAIDKALARREQVVLFFNRRGGASFVQCRNCSLVLRCRRCDTALSYHPAEISLICHHCSYKLAVPDICPRCSSRRIKFLGLGTQKLEQETAIAFPGARILRWDSDATRNKHAHRQILEMFRRHQADILIGTQMVAKGLDLPQITLVGVIIADSALNLPDFRAGERTFQLLSQVAGRAGRGVLGGNVIIQSYTPQHYAIQAALMHDYATFYEKEIEYRHHLNNPPFSRLLRLTFSHTNDDFCSKEAIRMKKLLIQQIDSKGIAGISLIGPAPAFTHRLRGRFRWQLILRTADPSHLLDGVALPQGWTVDVDPLGLS